MCNVSLRISMFINKLRRTAEQSMGITLTTKPDIVRRALKVRVNDGLYIAVEDTKPLMPHPLFGVDPAPAPLLCLAGLTRTMRDFYELRDYFTQSSHRPRRVVLLDARGRGTSNYAQSAADYTPLREADDAASVAVALGLHKPVIVGTSRGGILAMILAVAKPSMMAGAVLNDIGPRIAMRGLMRLRAQLGSHGLPENWDAAEAAIRTSMGHQFPAFSDADWARYTRLTFDEQDGKPKAAFDPLVLAGLAALSTKMPAPDLSRAFSSLVKNPTLVVHGEHSDLLDNDICQLASSMGAQVHDVQGQGHAPALRGELLKTIDAFLSENAL